MGEGTLLPYPFILAAQLRDALMGTLSREVSAGLKL